MLWYIGLLMAPPVVFLIPYFIFMSRLHLNGTYIAMIVMMQTLTIPFSVKHDQKSIKNPIMGLDVCSLERPISSLNTRCNHIC